MREVRSEAQELPRHWVMRGLPDDSVPGLPADGDDQGFAREVMWAVREQEKTRKGEVMNDLGLISCGKQGCAEWAAPGMKYCSKKCSPYGSIPTGTRFESSYRRPTTSDVKNLSAHAVSKALKVSEVTVHKYAGTGKIPSHTDHNGNFRFDLALVKEALDVLGVKRDGKPRRGRYS